MKTIDELVADIGQRFAAIETSISADAIKAMIQAALPDLITDADFVRKIKHESETPDPLKNTKFARFDLGVSDIEFLYDLQVSLKGQRKVDSGFYQGPSEELARAFENLSEAHYMSEDEVRRIDQRAIDNLFPRVPKHRGMTADQLAAARAQAIRAMDTAESGFGSQLIGAQYVRDLWEVARPETRVFGLIDSFEMTDPTVYLPVEVDIPEMLYVGENTANNSTDYVTVKTGSNRVQVDARKFIIHQMWSGELEEDSIIPFVPYLRRQAALSIAHYSDSLVLNGDTTNAATGNINLDDADPADTKHYLAFDGIRHAALVDNTGNTIDVGTLSIGTFRQLRATMMDTSRLVDWGHPTNPDDLVFITDPQTADVAALLDEVIQFNIQNPNGRGLLNGEVGRVLGHPVISSMAVPLTEADGKVSTTAGLNTVGQIVAFNRRGFKLGWRRRVKVETERLPGRDQTRIVYSLRMGFGRFTPTANATGIEAAAVGRNVSLA